MSACLLLRVALINLENKTVRFHQASVVQRFGFVLTLALSVFATRVGKCEPPIAKRVVFIIGENEYHTWETLPDFARTELEPRGLSCSFVMASPKEGDNVFTNFAVIRDADLLFVSVRRRTPPKEMMGLIRAHLQAGKPLAGIRTASHAFGAKPADELHEGWPAFDTEVLGCSYQGHYNNQPPNSPPTIVRPLSEVMTHPILKGIPTNGIRVTSHLYKSRDLAASTTPLLVGQVENQQAVEPVAWVNTDQNRRVFYTSLGSPDDFNQPWFRRLLVNGVFWSLNLPTAASASTKLQEPDSKPVSTSTPRQDQPLSPSESLSRFKVADDLQVDQVLTEPDVRQPVFLNFDERGRMWVVEYLQYPFPAGLKMLSHDSVWRAVYDKVPPPPPHHFVGADRISIYEDTTGTGVFHRSKTFVDGLNIVTAATKGRGGVWVLNPPYLLFYPDKNNDDIPDGDPEVVLSGFGLEDTHSVVNSLRWGPDGWLYACQGSTVTANIMRPGLDKAAIAQTMGQQIWRYHPETRRFEVFSEGGGNAFGCEIDEKGRIFSGHNGGNTRGFHYMQGAYLQKGFDKHGPLSNPYAFGYFPPMPHPAVDRFTHNFILYDGGALPARYNGKLFGVEPLQGRVVESEISPDGSSFKTRDLGYPVTTTDQWFRPVDIKVGPDGAIYIADWYDAQVNHYRNHQGQIDKSNGRIYRLKAKNAKPLQPFDLGKFSTQRLVALLGHTNKWFRQEALRLLGDRKDSSAIPILSEMVRTNTGQLALESLWGLNLSGGLSDAAAMKALEHTDPFVRLWTARLLCDNGDVSREVEQKLEAIAHTEGDVEVRAQLACSARRLPATKDLELVKVLLSHAEDSNEKRIPLLLWWAIESKCEKDTEGVLKLFGEPAIWQLPLVKQHILERLMRRFAEPGTQRDWLICAQLLRLSPGASQTAKLMAGFDAAFKGRSMAGLPQELVSAINRSGHVPLMIRLRSGEPQAVDAALTLVAKESAPLEERLQCIETLGELKPPKALPAFLRLVADEHESDLHPATLMALEHYEQPEIGTEVLSHFNSFSNNACVAAQSLLSSRTPWALQLLKAIEDGRIERQSISQDAIQKLRAYREPEIAELVHKLWGNEKVETTAEMKLQIEQYAATIRGGTGDPYEGRKLFGMSCGLCHKLYSQGGQVGPDLTPYKRDDLDTMLLNIVNPSAEIREGYESYVINTKDGRTLSGFLADKDNRVIVIRGVDGQSAVLPREQISEMKSTGVSLMPVGLLKAFSEQQVRDLFAYLRSSQPLVGEAQQLSRTPTR
jgi:putative heme-binding domain-containing protein